jgi:hypothetical protein
VETKEPIVAIGLLTQRDLDILGAGFHRAFPIDESPCFEELLTAIDIADKKRGFVTTGGRSVPS